MFSVAMSAQNNISVFDDKIGSNEEMTLPEGMQDAETDSLIKAWATRNLLHEGDCNMTDENPLFDKEVYIQRLSRLPNVIEMPYNSVVQKFIDQYSGRLRRSVSIMLGASNFYTPIFEEALEMYQIPLELKYLPVIESALNPNATSRVGAAGLWQFMITTGKDYGLEVTSLIDERRDPIKASYAAAHYLRDLYNIFGDWTLVIASYNCGPNNVSKAIKRAGGNKDYWEIYPYLPAETRGYVPAFIAANYIMNYYCEHHICPMKTTLPEVSDTILLSRNIAMEQISEMCDISMEEVRALNPQYRTSLIPGDSHQCSLRLPSDKISLFLEAGDSIYAHKADQLLTQRTEVVVNEKKVNDRSSRKTITVRKGDTLGAIASRNRTTVKNIQRLNGLRGTSIRPGQKLRVR